MDFHHHYNNKCCPGKKVKFTLSRLVKNLPEHLQNVYFKAVPTFGETAQDDDIDASQILHEERYPWLQKDNAMLRLLYSDFDIAL